MSDEKSMETQKAATDHTRRAFLKTALLGGATVASVGLLTKVAKKMKPEKDLKAAYLNDELQQDAVMKDKKYVLMTKEEKEAMINQFMEEYKYSV